jgi:photosystem II stability/assembly factor-like uncharacterized protein
MITRSSTRRKFSRGVFAVAALFMASSASAQVWRSAGLTGGDVRALAVDPRDPKIVYLGTTDGHIFASLDAGVRWKLRGLAGKNSNAVVTALLVDPRDSSRIYASTWTRERAGEGGGVFISLDSGASWQPSGLGTHAVRTLVQAASDSDIIAAGALDGVFVSRNSGRDWERVTPAGDPELRNFDSLAIDPQDADVIYAGTFHLPWKTEDGGKHWSPLHAGMIDDSDVLSLAIDGTNSQRIFASACSGIYRSDAAGAAWKKIAGIPYSSRRTLVIRQDPAHPTVLLAGTTEGLWKSEDAGTNWRRISPADWVINAILLEPASDPAERHSRSNHAWRLLLGTERQGVLASDDGGTTFQAVNDGFYHRTVLSVAVGEQDARQVAAVLANAPDAVVVSEDGGTTWAPMDRGLGNEEVRSIFAFRNGWWAAVASGGLLHYDGEREAWLRTGTFWTSPGGRNLTGALASPSQTVRPVVNDLYVSDTAWFAASQQGLFVSRDQGKTWSSLRFSSADLPVQSVRASPDGAMIRIASSGGMVFSDNAGRSWTWHDLPLDSGGALKLEWADQTTLVAQTRAGLYLSRDAGTSWIKSSAGLPGARVEELLVGPGLWLVSMQTTGEFGGLFASGDGGLSWSPLKPTRADPIFGGSGSPMAVLASAGAPERIFAGSASEGLYLVEFDHALSAGRERAAEAQVAAEGGR